MNTPADPKPTCGHGGIQFACQGCIDYERRMRVYNWLREPGRTMPKCPKCNGPAAFWMECYDGGKLTAVFSCIALDDEEGHYICGQAGEVEVEVA